MQVLKMKDVIKKTGRSRASIYRAIKDGTFVTPISLGSSAIGFLAEEIEQWIASRPRITNPVPCVPAGIKRGRPRKRNAAATA